MTPLLRSAALAGLVLLSAVPAALAFEDPPATDARTVLGDLASGPGYTVAPGVGSDGLLWVFTIRSGYGVQQVAGESLARERIRELEALRKLQAMSESDVFLKSLGQTAAAPLRYGADLIADPQKTLTNSANGLANMFDRIGSAVANRGATRDGVATSLLGIDSARRQLAVQLGVDPYSDYAPLASKLTEVARASALGNLSVKALLMVVPGGAGIAVSSASTVDTIRNTLAEKTSTQVVEIVLGMLARQKVPAAIAQRLVDNRFYTPADLLVMAHALKKLRAGNTALFVARAAEAAGREEAFFQRTRAVLLTQQASALGIGDFVDVGGFPLNRLKDGRLIALFPFDEVAWTQRVARAFDRAAKLQGQGTAPGLVLAITGSTTPMAAAEIQQRGWTIQKVN
jgi:hypothetical protein